MSTDHGVIIEFLLSSGCRNQELCLLNVRDADTAKREAKILGKGDKERIVYFSETAAIVINEYLKTRPKDTPPSLWTSLESQ